MPLYKLIGYDADSQLNTGCDFTFTNDAEAFAFASRLVTGDYRIAVWTEHRFVGRASTRVESNHEQDAF